MQSNLLGKTASIGTQFDWEGNPAAGGWTDRSMHDDKGFTSQATHEDQDRQGRPLAETTKSTRSAEGFKVVDTFTTFDKDKKPSERLTEKYDDKGRLRSRRREYFDKNGNVVGGTDTSYTYEAEGRMTEKQTSLP